MTTAKTTTTKKTTGRKPVSTKIAPAEEAVEVIPVAETVKIIKQYKPDDLVMCRSITVGKLVYIGQRTGTRYMWANSGDVAWLEYQDLMSAVLSRSAYIYNPCFLIEDEDILENPQCRDLKFLYDSLFERGDILKILELPIGKFKSTLKSLPIGMRNAIKSEIVTKIENGSFDSLQKIIAVDEEFGTDIKSLIS